MADTAAGAVLVPAPTIVPTLTPTNSNPFRWAERIPAAAARGYFDENDRYLAGTWGGCAYAEWCFLRGRENRLMGPIWDGLGGTLAVQMTSHGVGFTAAVAANNFIAAQQHYDAIMAVE